MDGGTARDALCRSIELAELGDRLGYRRYWAAEVHGMRGAASCAPAVLAGLVASRTRTIRVGAGGVLLPNHAPLVVSEQFGTLEAVHPGRIDLAVGRGSGAPKAARDAVHADRDDSLDGFAAQVGQLRAYFRDEVLGGVRSVPGFGNEPQLWMLGGSEDSARLAARERMPYAFGGFYNRTGTDAAARTYLRAARSDDGWRPYLGVWVGVIAADTAEEAEHLAGSYRLKNATSRLHGRKIRLPDADVAARQRPTDPDELAVFHAVTDGFVIGDGPGVRRRLAEFRERTGADELILRTPVHDRSAKLRSYELVAASGP